MIETSIITPAGREACRFMLNSLTFEALARISNPQDASIGGRTFSFGR